MALHWLVEYESVLIINCLEDMEVINGSPFRPYLWFGLIISLKGRNILYQSNLAEIYVTTEIAIVDYCRMSKLTYFGNTLSHESNTEDQKTRWIDKCTVAFGRVLKYFYGSFPVFLNHFDYF